jgi:hypothetical protein
VAIPFSDRHYNTWMLDTDDVNKMLSQYLELTDNFKQISILSYSITVVLLTTLINVTDIKTTYNFVETHFLLRQISDTKQTALHIYRRAYFSLSMQCTSTFTRPHHNTG